MSRRGNAEFDTPVFVLGANGPNALGITRCFGRRNIPVYVVDSSYAAEHRLSRYGRLLRSPPLDFDNADLADFLVGESRKRGGRPVLFPTNDKAVLYSLTFRERLEPSLRFTSSPLSVVRQLLDKAEFSRLVARLGVGCPRTVIPATAKEALAAAEAIGLPCLLKPALSQPFGKIFGRKGFLIRDKPELTHRWSQTQQAGIAMLVQDIIPGNRLCGWSGYYSDELGLVAWSGYWKQRQFPPDFGIGTLLRAGLAPEFVQRADAILRHVHYRGIVEPEFKYDPRDGQWKIVEINPRSIVPNRLSAAVGVDLEYIAYLDALGEPLPLGKASGNRVSWTETHKDFASAFSEPDMTIGKWLRTRRGPKVYAYFAWDDPLPVAARLPEAARTVAGTLCRRWFPGLYRRLRNTHVDAASNW